MKKILSYTLLLAAGLLGLTSAASGGEPGHATPAPAAQAHVSPSASPQGEVSPSPSVAKPPMPAGNPDLGKRLYQNNCAACHGVNGLGNGPVASALNPRPANFKDPNLKNRIILDAISPDEEWFAVIKRGGSATKRSSSMPAWSSQLKDSDIRNVIAYIHQLQKK